MSTSERIVIELSPELLRVIDAAPGRPPELIDPRTSERYVLVRLAEFERQKPRNEPVVDDGEIPEGIRRSRTALSRDLPALLANRRTRGRWICYRGDERVGISRNKQDLVQECIRRGYREDEYLITLIEHGADLEEEEIEDLCRKYDLEDPTD